MIKKQAKNHVPRVLVVGPTLELAQREAIREMGADWILCEPYSDPELRFFVNAARTNRNWKFQRQSVRVPIETIAWIRAGAKRGSGVVTSLSRRGAFIETTDAYDTSRPIRLEFKLDERRISVFANVTRVTEEQRSEGEVLPAGIDVIFYEVDDVTDAAISDAVEMLWAKFRP
jgi:DNA-binding response OmpR family regulator